MAFWQQTSLWPEFSWGSTWRGSWRGSWQGSWQDSWRTSWRNFWRDSRHRTSRSTRPDFAALRHRLASDEAELRQKFWRRVKREAASLPFLEDALTAHYCAFDRHTPLYVKAALVGAIVYFAVPDDLVPDALLGVADDAAIMAAAFKLVSAHIKPEHRQAAKEAVARLRA